MTTDADRSDLISRLRAHSQSSAALIIAFLWGLAEATVFFIVPDVVLGFVALFHWRRGLLAALVAVAGAVLGGAATYTLAASDPAAATEILLRIPLIDVEMIKNVGAEMQAAGLIALVRGPVRAVPYKVYAVQAGQQQLPLWRFLLITIPARLERLLPVTLAAAGVGVVFRGFIRRRTALVVGIYILLWVGVYVAYYLQLT
jgi:membrane protein YqaA with SNARE-associated domain